MLCIAIRLVLVLISLFLCSFARLGSAQSASASSAGASVTTEETQIGAWLLHCVTMGEEERNCALIIGIFNSLEQRELGLLRIFPVAPEDKVGNETFAAQLSTPTHVLLREQVTIQVDQQLIKQIDYEICSYNQCITTFAISSALQTAFSEGFNGTIRLVDASGQEQLLDFALEGFARGLSLLEESI